MGKNKLSKFADLATYEHVVQISFKELQSEEFRFKGKWNEAFFGNSNPVILELGCGKGEYTVKLAQHYPEMNFIGIDIKGSRMWKGATQAKELGLKNVGFLRTNIENIRLFFAENEIAEIWLTFPDPQMKKARKRLTATNFIESYRQIMVSNGIIHLKSDSNFMYQYTEAMVAENQLEVIRQTDNLYQSEILDEVLSIQTFYEKQWLDRGLTIKYLAFKLSHQEPLREPDVEIEKDPYRSFGRSAKEASPPSKGLGEASFYDKVYAVTRLIPAGRVTSYGAIAAYLGTAQSSRMVGWAMNNAHVQEKYVPAHRVVNRNGLLTGKHHFGTAAVMQELLEAEGIRVIDDQIVDFKNHFWNPTIELAMD